MKTADNPVLVGTFEGEDVYRNSRSYFTKSWSYPRITRALEALSRPGLNRWRENVGTEIADETVEQARDIGSVTHDYIKWIIRGFSFNESKEGMFRWSQLAQEVRNSLMSWESFRQTLKPKIKETELLLVSKTYGYAGTTDCVALVNKELEIIDWKTANQLWVEVEFQLAAYAMAYFENTGKMPVRCRAIRLDKEKGYWSPKTDQVILTDIPRAFKGFLGLFDAYKYLGGKR